jgi:hypothetical protein
MRRVGARGGGWGGKRNGCAGGRRVSAPPRTGGLPRLAAGAAARSSCPAGRGRRRGSPAAMWGPTREWVTGGGGDREGGCGVGWGGGGERKGEGRG